MQFRTQFQSRGCEILQACMHVKRHDFAKWQEFYSALNVRHCTLTWVSLACSCLCKIIGYSSTSSVKWVIPPVIGLTLVLAFVFVMSICKNAVYRSCTLFSLMYSWYRIRRNFRQEKIFANFAICKIFITQIIFCPVLITLRPYLCNTKGVSKIFENFIVCLHLVSRASPSYEKIEKGSGQVGCTNVSQRNAIIAIKMCVK